VLTQIEEKDITMNDSPAKIDLKVNQFYRNKRGEVVMITDTVGPDNRWDFECGMRFKDNVGRTYRPDGTYNNIPGENHLDLCSQITDPKELVVAYTTRMSDIYDADRDYDICLGDLPRETQDTYAALKKARDDLLK
jgi:hypothetical protein